MSMPWLRVLPKSRRFRQSNQQFIVSLWALDKEKFVLPSTPYFQQAEREEMPIIVRQKLLRLTLQPTAVICTYFAESEGWSPLHSP